MLLFLPINFLRLFIKSFKLKEYRYRWYERLGLAKLSPQYKHGILLHSVSLGETIAATPIIKKLQQLYPGTPITVTTTTPTGSAFVTDKIPNVQHCYLPIDISFLQKIFLGRLQPKLIVIMETEIWPSLYLVAKNKNIPILIANARISNNSYKGYMRFQPLFKWVLNNVAKVIAQSQLDGQRYLDLGLSNKKLKVAGNIKFDISYPQEVIELGLQLKSKVRGRFVFIAASTHAGEEEKICAAYKSLLIDIPELLLVLVPRHPDRFNAVADLLVEQQLSFVKTSESMDISSAQVLLVDEMGKMGIYYSMCDVAFVGGSFAPIGGHNLLEPASLTKPVITGNNYSNFHQVAKLLLDKKALIVVNDEFELQQAVLKLFSKADYCAQLGANAFDVVQQNQGSLDAIINESAKLANLK